MLKYVKDFYKSRHKDPWDYINCEKCNKKRCDDIHHIQQSFRGKRTHSEDWSDLIWVCRDCHQEIHANNTFEMRQNLLTIVKNILLLIN